MEDGEHYLGDSLMQAVEGVDDGHVPPLALGHGPDDLAGIALSAQLQTEPVRTSSASLKQLANLH